MEEIQNKQLIKIFMDAYAANVLCKPPPPTWRDFSWKVLMSFFKTSVPPNYRSNLHPAGDGAVQVGHHHIF